MESCFSGPNTLQGSNTPPLHSVVHHSIPDPLPRVTAL
jgi:hypothetical protein